MTNPEIKIKTSADQPLAGKRRLTMLAHLEELRRCVINLSIVWLLCVIAVAPFSPGILQWLAAPLQNCGFDTTTLLRGMRLESGFNVMLTTMLWCGTTVSLPINLILLARFIFPALTSSEKRAVTISIFSAALLFILGAYFCYDWILPKALQALIGVNVWMGLEPGPFMVENYAAVILKIILAFGIAFQMPLLLLTLGWLGIFDADMLSKKRPYAVIIIFTLAAILTPPDVISQIAMALPMCLLYEICILLIKIRKRTRPA